MNNYTYFQIKLIETKILLKYKYRHVCSLHFELNYRNDIDIGLDQYIRHWFPKINL